MTNTIGRTFGIEIETVGIGQDAAARALEAAGLNARTASYSGSNYSVWQAKPDGSLSSPNGRSAEITSPILTWGNAEHYAQVERACAALRDAGATVNRSCGLHVHVGVGDLTRSEILGVARGYTAAQYSIDANVSASRVNGQWCHYLPSFATSAWTDLRDRFLRSGSAHGRYYTVNLESYAQRGTVEFRQRNGSVNARKILTWAGLMVSLTRYGAEAEDREDLTPFDAAGRTADGVWDFLAQRGSLDAHAALWRDGGRPVALEPAGSFSRLLRLQGLA